MKQLTFFALAILFVSCSSEDPGSQPPAEGEAEEEEQHGDIPWDSGRITAIGVVVEDHGDGSATFHGHCFGARGTAASGCHKWIGYARYTD